MHADAANSDYTPAPGYRSLDLRWSRDLEGDTRIGPFEWTINLGPTISPDGHRVYVTSTAQGCNLQALDTATGKTLWCAPEVDRFAVVSSPLIDQQGVLYLADGSAMRAFGSSGSVLWSTPIVGVPLSAQFTSEGRLIFITHVGTIHVLDRATGHPMLSPLELIPGATWNPSEDLFACARGTQACPSANTIAFALERGQFFFTFWAPGKTQADIRAMAYTENPEPVISNVWINDALPGGSGSSPALSADGNRLYVTDNVDALHAIDTTTGNVVWSQQIGYAAGGSASVSPSGIVIPAGGRGSAVQAIRDDGDHATLVWRREDLDNRSIVPQSSGSLAYALVDRGQLHNDLVVLDTATGVELDRNEVPGTSIFGVGTTIGPDGVVYVATIVGGLLAFDEGK
ncbi:outer membrane protein assembly factor BamB family protein [Nocardia testacea]|uniref:outer membrane protein assembly factor BamB family protein n=1 Tax=Nocardia testacea TaxID=248551 RepID=UPI000683D87A|nr:PQQ-binding-like beta-propeller repeat protein [Nocardia testacea]